MIRANGNGVRWPVKAKRFDRTNSKASYSMRGVLKIAIDFDGTLADANAIKAQWIKQNLGIDVPPWKCSRTSCVPIIGSANYELMGEFVYGDEATSKMQPNPGAVQAIEALSSGASLYIVTNRRASNVPFAQRWLDAQRIAKFFHAVLSSEAQSKAAICQEHGINILLDDDIRHLIGNGNQNLSMVQFKPDWDECPLDDVVCIKTWQEFVAYVGTVSRKISST
jgi:hypothetical protein